MSRHVNIVWEEIDWNYMQQQLIKDEKKNKFVKAKMKTKNAYSLDLNEYFEIATHEIMNGTFYSS